MSWVSPEGKRMVIFIVLRFIHLHESRGVSRGARRLVEPFASPSAFEFLCSHQSQKASSHRCGAA